MQELRDDAIEDGDAQEAEDTRLLGPSSHQLHSDAEPATAAGPSPDALNAQSLSKLELSRLLALARPQAGRLVVALAALVLASGSFLVVPAMMGAVIDAVMNPTSARWSLIQAVIALFVVFLLSSVFTFIRTVLFTTAGERIVADLRQDIFSSILKQEIGFFDVNKTGELMNRLSSDCTVLQQTVTVNLSMGLRWGIQAVGGFFVLFFISWKLTLVMFTIFPLIALASWVYGKYVRSLSKEVQERLADASSVAEETLSSIRTVRAFTGEFKEIERYTGKITMSFEAAQKRAYAEGTFAATATLIANAAIAAVLWYGGSLVLSGEISVGTLTSFILYTLTVAVSFGGLSTLYGDLMKAVGASERVFYLVDRSPQVPFSGGRPIVRNGLEGSIEFSNVSFSYPSRPEHPVLQDFSLNLPCGQVVALVGHSGGGKSTVAHLIEGFYRPTGGNILLDGVDITQFEPRQLRRIIGIVTQEPTLFGCSIAENISYGADAADFPTPEALRQAVVSAAKLAHAHEFICDFPQQYDTLVGERGVRLSGGQKQRIAIARALLIDPKILLLDEATSALDAESEYLVKSALDTLIRTSAHRRTVLVIAHRLSTVKNADRVAVIKSGHVVEEGSHEQLVERNGEYKRLVSRQLLAQD